MSLLRFGFNAALLFSLLTGTLYAENEGLPRLDEAIRVKLSAERLDELENVVQLCEQALEQGLSQGHTKIAKQLMSATLYERAFHVVAPILEGQVDRSWLARRKQALDDLERAVDVNPQDGEAHLLIARLHELPGGDAKKGRTAAGAATELLQDKPDRHSLALTARAAFQTDVNKRLADYDEAIRVDKGNTVAWRERGRTKLASGDPEKALEDFTHLLNQNEEDVEALQAMAEALVSLEKYDESLEHLDRLIEIDPDVSLGYSLRARVRLVQGQVAAAEEDLNKAIKIEPRDLVALMMRGRLRLAQEKLELALGDANRILELRPGLPQAILLRSLIHTAAKDYENAISDLQRLLRRDADNVELQLQIASIYNLDGRPRKAIEVFDRILAKEEDQWEALRGRADAHLSIGQHGRAIDDYERAMKIEPNDSGVLNNLAWVLATSPLDDLRDGQRAIDLATRACDVTEYKAPHILSTLAAGYAETGDFDKAIEWSTKAVETGPGSIREQLQQELDSYKEKKPWREMQETEDRSGPPAPDLSDLFADTENNKAAAADTGNDGGKNESESDDDDSTTTPDDKSAESDSAAATSDFTPSDRAGDDEGDEQKIKKKEGVAEAAPNS